MSNNNNLPDLKVDQLIDTAASNTVAKDISKMTEAELRAEYERVLKENLSLKSRQKPNPGPFYLDKYGRPTLKGIGRFGLSLEGYQWVKVFEEMGIPMPDSLKTFIAENKEAITMERDPNYLEKSEWGRRILAQKAERDALRAAKKAAAKAGK